MYTGYIQGPDLQRFVSRSYELRKTYEKLMKNLLKSYEHSNLRKILGKTYDELTKFVRFFVNRAPDLFPVKQVANEISKPPS